MKSDLIPTRDLNRLLRLLLSGIFACFRGRHKESHGKEEEKKVENVVLEPLKQKVAIKGTDFTIFSSFFGTKGDVQLFSVVAKVGCSRALVWSPPKDC